MLYICQVCGYVYDSASGDPENDVPPSTDLEDVPVKWECPLCGADKDMFDAADEEKE